MWRSTILCMVCRVSQVIRQYKVNGETYLVKCYSSHTITEAPLNKKLLLILLALLLTKCLLGVYLLCKHIAHMLVMYLAVIAIVCLAVATVVYSVEAVVEYLVVILVKEMGLLQRTLLEERKVER